MGGTVKFWFGPQGDTLRRYIESRRRVTFIMGPIGSGKTYGSAQRVFDQICEQTPNAEGVRKSRWFAVRNTYTDLRNTTIKDWCDLFDNESVFLGKLNRDSPPTHYLDFDLTDGTRVKAEVVFLALDRPQDVRKLRGAQATGFWLNEVKELSKDIVDMCDGRHGRYPSKAEVKSYWHGMIGDTNAPDDDHWYYKLAEEVQPADWLFLRQPGGVIEEVQGTGPEARTVWRENPAAENLANLPGGYYINQVQGKDDDWIRVNLANEYGAVVTGLPVYKGSWHDAYHVSKFRLGPIKGHGKIMVGIDFGRTPAAIFGQLTPSGRLRVLKEYVTTDMGIRKFMDEVFLPGIKRDFPGYTLRDFVAYADPAGWNRNDVSENSPIKVLNKQYKLKTYATSTNKPQSRQEAVRWYLNNDVDGEPALLLSADCRVLRKGFLSGYHYRRVQVSGEARYHNEPEKNAYSHPHDATQYLCLGAQGKLDYDKTEALDAVTTEYSRPLNRRTGY